MNICQCHACALVLVHLACNLLALVQVDCALVLVQVACKLLALVQVKMCNACVCSSGETLCRNNCQLIGMSLIGLARQVQKNRD